MLIYCPVWFIFSKHKKLYGHLSYTKTQLYYSVRLSKITKYEKRDILKTSVTL